ncbi:hypothetical protein BCR43DRAFT_333980 [Syncephalastrum racemosum]|uniref:Integrator complex subunit 7 N-terminal domain-containing protein n=1 Tax=Syncephalastrum racemosum TaxID=13706 RepID=A0A1X2H8B8_SYNRA|nr:hypothetical protein BCR43DRAFT_333980 [Syncephalastrum racemosum]
MAASGNAQTDGHRALLEIESRFNAKSRGVVLGIQGSQLLALAMFADLFERFPYPVMINAALLKLADWFRTSNNAVKFHIYKVLKNASDEHLARVINIEEMVRRVTPVLSSNDLLARALTLRVLGCISMIIADNMEVHHAVLERLADATERVEMEAAIWATDRLCACSTQFPSIVFPQIISKLNDPSISFDSKLRLVKVFQHMHRDMRMADKAKAACLELLGTADLGENLVNTILRTMTLLLSEGLIMSQTSTDRTDQVDRLINYLIHDNREKVRMSALDDLILLARKDMSFDRNQIMASKEHDFVSRYGMTDIPSNRAFCAS